MIVWIASYPRSGNTLLRIMLQRVFNVQSYSKYDDLLFVKAGSKVSSAVGHVQLNQTWDDFYRAKLHSPELNLVKTHEAPVDGEPAIYVVRNGPAAVSSYLHFSRTYDKQDYPLEELIVGSRGAYPTWGAHLDAWDPAARPRTLILKYEDLVSQPEGCIDQLATFLQLKKQSAWINDFASLQQLEPDFFRQGKTAPGRAELSAAQLELFDLVHGDWMARWGYSTSAGASRQFCRTLRTSIHSVDRAGVHNPALASASREIQELQRICAERLALIERLHAECAALRPSP